MIEFTDQHGKPVYVNPHHIKVLTDNGSGGTRVWLAYREVNYTASGGSFLNVVESPDKVARAIREAIHPRAPYFSLARPRRPRSVEKGPPPSPQTLDEAE